MLSYDQWKNKKAHEQLLEGYIPTEPSKVSPQVFQGSTNNKKQFGVDNRGRNSGRTEEAGGHPTLSYGLPVRSFKEYVQFRLHEFGQPLPGQPQPPAPGQPPAPAQPGQNPPAPGQPQPPAPGAPAQPGQNQPAPGAPQPPAPGAPAQPGQNQPAPGAPQGGGDQSTKFMDTFSKFINTPQGKQLIPQLRQIVGGGGGAQPAAPQAAA